VSEGILWLPEEAIVRAQSDGFVTGILVKPGAVVEKGTELFRHDDRDLAAELVVEQARVEAAAARLARDEAINPLQTGVSRRELDVERAALSRVSEKWNELTVASKASGEFVVPRAEDVLGRYHKRGEVLAYIVPSTARTARVIVRQDDIDLVRQLVVGAELRLATNIADIHPARIMREVPAASNEFPDEALTLQGGGSFAADMRDPAHPRALNRLFQFDVELPPEAAITTALGEHVWVRFYHGIEPLGFQWWRRIRQLFLTRFDA
jgi:putative peptide zinc metalloprotease protein